MNKTSGFDIDISYEHSETVPKGEVISQSPAKGSEVVRGAQVKVVVSKGRGRKKPVENVTLSVTIPYEPPVSDAIDEELDEDGNLREPEQEPEPVPQHIKIYIEDRTNKLQIVFMNLRSPRRNHMNSRLNWKKDNEAHT